MGAEFPEARVPSRPGVADVIGDARQSGRQVLAELVPWSAYSVTAWRTSP